MRSVVVMVLALATLTAGCADNPPSSDAVRTTVPSPTAGTTTASGAVSSGPTQTAATPTRTVPSTAANPRGTIITTAASDYGTMLFDRVGQAIYLFDREDSSTPQCYGACAQAWPPVLTTDPPRARTSVRQNLLGTTRRRDGSRQVTYNGHPLYYYAHESPDQVLCHNVDEFGGLWLVVTPAGKPAG